MTAPRRELATSLVLGWLLVMAWHLTQLQTQATDIAWLVKLAVRNIAEVLLWTAAWAWVTRVQRGEALLSQHVAWVAGACLLDEAGLSLAMPWLFFTQGWPWPEGLHRMCWTALACVTALAQLRLATGEIHARRIALWLAASALTLVLVALQTWAEHNDREGIKKLPYDANIYPPLVLKAPTYGLEDGLSELWTKQWLQTDIREAD